jgi:hypothetical protein
MSVSSGGNSSIGCVSGVLGSASPLGYRLSMLLEVSDQQQGQPRSVLPPSEAEKFKENFVRNVLFSSSYKYLKDCKKCATLYFAGVFLNIHIFYSLYEI